MAVFGNEDPFKNNKIFHLQKNNPQAKALVYNDYYLVVGNSEIRIKRGQDKVESQIPNAFQYFNTSGESDPSFMFGNK